MRIRKFIYLICFFLLAGAILPTGGFAAGAMDNYQFYCAQCHGVGGDGLGVNKFKNLPADPRDFTDAAYMRSITDDYIIRIITEGGKPPAVTTVMPAYSMTLTAEEIKALKDILRGFCDC